jgi:hypothetical protein
MTTIAPYRCAWCDSIDSPRSYGCDICSPGMKTMCDEEPEMQTRKAGFATYTHYPRIESGIVSMKELPDGWVAAKASDQAEADRKASKMLKSLEDVCAVPGVLTSSETISYPRPLLWLTNLKGPVSLDRFLKPPGCPDWIVKPFSVPVTYIPVIGLDLVIVSGGDKPLHPAWVRQIRDECRKAGVAFVFTGWGEWVPKRQRSDLSLYSNLWGTLDSEGDFSEFATPWNGHDDDGVGDEALILRVTSDRSGRILDGTTHDRYPEGL